MELNKEFITKFNKYGNKDTYRVIVNKYIPDNKKCRKCDDVIYYYDSRFKISNNILVIIGKSYLSIKNINKEYNLSICEDCLSQKYPEYQDKNKSRVFNQMNYITEYAFDIPIGESLKWMKEKYAITEKNLIKKWGIEIGQQKWKSYKEKQSISNKFEYKKIKHGWTKKQYDDYNKSRSVTLENIINRHGYDNGIEIWDNYIEKQRYSTTLKYFIEKHGIDKGQEVYNNFCRKRVSSVPYSMVSKKLFDELSNKLNNYKLYYAENEWYSYDNINKKYYLVDFYIRDLNIGIEFNGDTYHANPSKYKPNDKPIYFQSEKTSQDIWDYDKIKNDYLRTKLKKLIIIWEHDLYKDGVDKTIDKILKEINEQ